jgi:hypothetical protein
LALTACYHQVVDTGLSPGTKTIEKPWTATWLWGLVPATPIDVRSECTSGVAFVDTQMTVPNGLVSFITLGIYTPRSVKVTCASGTASTGAVRIEVASSDARALDAALRQAARLATQTGHGVYVVFPASDAGAITSDGGAGR